MVCTMNSPTDSNTRALEYQRANQSRLESKQEWLQDATSRMQSQPCQDWKAIQELYDQRKICKHKINGVKKS